MMVRLVAGRKADAGITLIEMLVVLSIISIAAGVLVLQFSGASRSDTKAEAAHLADVLTQAGETALYSGNPGALIWSQTGYRIESFKPGLGWQIAEGNVQHDLGVGLTLTRADGRDGPLMIAPGGIALPARFLLTNASAAWRVDFNGLSAEVKSPGDDGSVAP